ncbi:MAG TPA: hypothetical protein IAC04_01215 [Candidatus Coprenecus stercoravium]|uniref:Uncharacterized protein n=1 Tax=Candidatus Coprenecus stercoravium TaxID=2840735 RepID=A0A9D2K869_9BACT|nr:hypothetical protein [Candidatus Coprenecus stercoravium]
MESPFTHNTVAAGSDFLARKKELAQLTANISSKTHTVIYEPPRTGKQSLVRMALSQSTVPEDGILEADLLSDIDSARLTGIVEKGREYRVVYLRNFQNVLKFGDWEKCLGALGREMPGEDAPMYIITGSGVNAMKHIFEERKFLYRQFERIQLSPIDEKSISDHIIKTFLRVGRVVETSQTEFIYNITDGHPWYIWQIANSCFNLTKGYLSNNLITEAVESLLYTHSVRFQEIVDNLSRYQLYFLRAVFDGITKASSADVITNYNLNSSANVHRIKEALTKKEVIVIDSGDCPKIIDPIFRLWLEKCYFTDL